MRSVAIFAAAFAVSVGRAQAQGLPTLTISALSLTTERTSAPAGRTFHVTVHVRTKQHVTGMPWLVLPNFTNLTILGDEKRTTASPEGTDYREVISVAGIAPGEATVSPAYVDALDPSRGGRPFRFSSNSLRIAITGDVAFSQPDPWRVYGTLALRLAGGLVIAVGLLLGMFAVINRAARLRRRTYVTLPTARPVEPRPVQTLDRAAIIRTAATQLAASRTRENAATLRMALFALAGARSDETLSALLERVPQSEPALRGALRMAERATFVEDANLQGAIEDLLDAVRRMSFV